MGWGPNNLPPSPELCESSWGAACVQGRGAGAELQGQHSTPPQPILTGPSEGPLLPGREKRRLCRGVRICR